MGVKISISSSFMFLCLSLDVLYDNLEVSGYDTTLWGFCIPCSKTDILVVVDDGGLDGLDQKQSNVCISTSSRLGACSDASESYRAMSYSSFCSFSMSDPADSSHSMCAPFLVYSIYNPIAFSAYLSVSRIATMIKWTQRRVLVA